MTKSQEKTMALKDFLFIEKRFNKTIKRLNHLMEKEKILQFMNIPMEETLKEELDEKFKLIGQFQMRKLNLEIKLGFHKSTPHLN
jgi:Txe/YoeB family toxin of Txe-Axe toxin-antitoxin module